MTVKEFNELRRTYAGLALQGFIVSGEIHHNSGSRITMQELVYEAAKYGQELAATIARRENRDRNSGEKFDFLVYEDESHNTE